MLRYNYTVFLLLPIELLCESGKLKTALQE